MAAKPILKKDQASLSLPVKIRYHIWNFLDEEDRVEKVSPIAVREIKKVALLFLKAGVNAEKLSDFVFDNITPTKRGSQELSVYWTLDPKKFSHQGMVGARFIYWSPDGEKLFFKRAQMYTSPNDCKEREEFRLWLTPDDVGKINSPDYIQYFLPGDTEILIKEF